MIPVSPFQAYVSSQRPRTSLRVINVFEKVMNISMDITNASIFSLAFDEPTRDADLMPDTFRDRKVRFLCITRGPPAPGYKAYILEDVKLINERDPVPPLYDTLTQTVDTYERGTGKRMICIKLVERQSGAKCICDIIFLYRTKRPPPYYTLLGEINGLQMCIKEGNVPVQITAPPPSNLYPHAMLEPSDHQTVNYTTKKSDEKEILDGIPFQINAKYLLANRNVTNDLSEFESIHILSPFELEQLFNYDFNLENSSIALAK